MANIPGSKRVNDEVKHNLTRDSESDSLAGGPDPYHLLRLYAREAKQNARAYSYSEAYYRWLDKLLVYPLVVTNAATSVLAGLNISPWIIMGISCISLILVGYRQAIDPKDKEHRANQVRIEFREISANIKQFILENDRTRDEIKSYTSTIHELLNVWESLAPPIQSRFTIKAQHESAKRTRIQPPRSSNRGIKKDVVR